MGENQITKWKEGKKLLKKFWDRTSENSSPNLDKMVKNISYSALDLLEKMLHLNPKKRISMKKILKHPFFHKDSINSPQKPLELSFQENSYQGENKNNGMAYPKAALPSKEVIKKRLITRIKGMDQLNLSKVNETDNENSIDMTPAKTNGKRRSSIADHYFKPKVAPSEFKKIASQRRISVQPALLGLHAPALQPRNEGFSSRGSPIRPVSGINSLEDVSSPTSSLDEIDILRKKIERKNNISNPTSLKNMQMISGRNHARSSLSINRELEPTKVDKYFTDLNGRSILSTMNSSNDLFSNITLNSSNRKRSSLNGSRSNIGFNAGNQVIFGSIKPNIGNIPSGSRGSVDYAYQSQSSRNYY